MLLATAAAGDQFVVAETVGFASTPAAIAVQANGSFTAAWESFEEEASGSGFGVFAQRFNADGTPVAPSFQVNTVDDREQSAPAIAVDAAGNHLIVWQSKGQDDVDGDTFGIYGQWYNNAGPLGSEFKINTATSGDQKSPSVAIDGSGKAIVSWQSFGQDGSDWGVYYTRLDAVVGVAPDTTPSGDVLVNDATAGIQQNPTVVAAANGNFVIAWEAIEPLAGDDASLDIYAKAYNAAGGEITLGEQLVNSDQLRDQVTPQAAIDADGDFVVVWVAGGIPGSGSDVFGQRFNELGTRAGQQFRVNNTTSASQVGGVVSMDSAGNFLVGWQSVHQDGFSEGIFGREYDFNGNTLVDEFQVNTVTEGPQSVPSIGMNGTGRAVVTWHGKNEDHESALFAQRFQVPNTDLNLFRVGSETELASFVELEGSRASAAMDLLGNSVVVFESYDEDGDALGVFGQLLDNFGDPLGGAFLVNTEFATGNQGAPAVGRAPNGNFVVAWHSKDQDGSGYGIFAQRYNAAGAQVGSAFQVNTQSIGDQVTPTVAMGDDGRFVIAWQGADQDDDGVGSDIADGTSDIFARRYDSAGSPIGLEFQVNQEEATDQIMPAVTMNAAGKFAIAWVSSHPAATIPEIDPEKSVFVQWYNENGVSTGSEVLAHAYVKDAQESPQIGMDAAGNFVVAWQSINQDGGTWGVYARQFLASKSPVQPTEFQVNQITEGLQRLVGLGVDAAGNFVIAFENTLPGTDDGISTDIYRREYFPNGTANGNENLVNTWSGGPQTLPVVARAATGNYGIFWMGQGFSHIDGVHGRLYDVNLVDDPGEPSRIPVGDQFLVGQTIGFEFGSPAIAVHGDGSFTLAFETFEEDTSGFGIFTQRFDATGNAIPGSRVQVNTTVVDDQSAPAIASDGAGNVLIVWQSKDTSGSGIFGQWLSAAGVKVGSEFRLNSTIIGDQTNPDVAIDENGTAIVAWQSVGQDGAGLGVYYTLLDTVGDDIRGSEHLANVSTAGDQQSPRVSAAAFDSSPGNNQFVIAWQGPGEAVTEASVEIFARRLSPAGAPQGSEFVVNSILTKDQILPDLGMDAAGNVVFVWQSEGQSNSGSDVYTRQMTAAGNLLGSDVLVNTTKTRPQRLPSVAVDAAGNSLVSWQSQHQDGYSWGIYRQAFNAAGGRVGEEVIVNHRVEGPQTAPTVSSNATGDAVVAWLGNSSTHEPSIFAHLFDLPATEVEGEIILTSYAGLEEMPPAAAMNGRRESVVAWTSYAEDGSGQGVFAQLLNDQGLPIGSRFTVNEFTQGNQGAPAVARAADGRFVIAWESEDQDGSGYGIYARRYFANGSPDGAIFKVNTVTAGDQRAPTVAIAPDGHFVIAWESAGANGLDIKAQRYLASGAMDGSEFRVNNEVLLDQFDPSIAMNAAGQFVIAWVSDHPAAVPGTEDTEKSIFAQCFNSNGQPAAGNEVLVHRYVKDGQEAPAVGIDGSGRFVVAWQSINQDGNSWGIFARRFEANKTPIERREFVVNETRMGPQRYVGLGMDEFGRFVVTWQSNTRAELTDGGSGGGGGGGEQEPGSPEGSSWDLFARQYSANGSPEGGELSVNSWQMGPQILPVVAQAPGGDFGIFWLGQGPDHVEGVHGRLYQSLFDFGDAPDPFLNANGRYPTLLSSNGARHLPGSKLFLGSGVDAELNGQPNTSATGDDFDANGDDEDGVILPASLFSGLSTTITVTASLAGKLDAWIDFDRDGIFEATEQIATNLSVIAGQNSLAFTVPSTAIAGTSFARFRVSSAGGLSSLGAAADGEVEDYSVQVVTQGGTQLIDDPANPGKKILLVIGTNSADYIYVYPSGSSIQVIQVRIGGSILGGFPAASISKIEVHGLGGADYIYVYSTITKPTELYGDAGNDYLYGGSGPDLIYGGDGVDRLTGGDGNDQLVGGSGGDYLYGGAGVDSFTESGAGAFVVTSTQLKVGSETNNLNGLEQATLVGDNGKNSFNVTGWSGSGTVDGRGGIDKLIVAGNANFTLSDSQLTRSVGAAFALTSIEDADLTGGTGNNVLDATGFSGQLKLSGGAGNDTLKSGAGPAILLGGTGNDLLQAATGRTLMIGGTGVDRLVGGGNEDLLIDGTTSYDSNAAALLALLNEWNSAGDYATRVANLNGTLTGGLNGTYRLTSTTVKKDTSVDVLTGNAGLDWYFAKLAAPYKDSLTDQTVGEIAN
ncbi:Bifunctional hemolysin/adenylate cyclase precursor [Anatilimnocola aggregata]|uniref:Bifunctional hemolysin/adenylate cyclase n=1 Tax=Anatilimnocola aggregata TaxID=2528021 RepID=A0A517YKC8_9BACT|nr:calcium-binding protein [Anatilimnocola aggregata]QDU30673.1 Bifunctional hemolysin/adenylate cyclase precursor [Anatilimnocola aggregata]